MSCPVLLFCAVLHQAVLHGTVNRSLSAVRCAARCVVLRRLCDGSSRGCIGCHALTPPLPLPSCPISLSPRRCRCHPARLGTPGNQAWQQLWSTGGACTGMGAQDYFQLMADTFGAYDPAVSGKAEYCGLAVAQQTSVGWVLHSKIVFGCFKARACAASLVCITRLHGIPAPTHGCLKHSRPLQPCCCPRRCPCPCRCPLPCDNPIALTLIISLLRLQRALAPGDLQINRSDLIAALSGTWGAEPWVACNAS